MSVITAFGPNSTFIRGDVIQQACNQQQGYEMVQATDKEIRYLGCYFSSSNSRKRSIKRLQDIIERFLNPIRRKHITVEHIAYLINYVLISRVVYVAQLMTLSENEWNLLFTPVIKLVKQICSNSLASRSIMIRCRAAQLRLAIHDNIFEHESGTLFLGHQEAKSTWTINGGNIPIRKIFITHRCLNLLRKIGTSNSYPLIPFIKVAC
ncbi:hypothetical protein C1646_778100 [Rhizophagus diaphanus]|nr:hypothetical protein C1646_778100 [Rhizophagus diaphanus] [Rhizophagus sp. MUCL 43196]